MVALLAHARRRTRRRRRSTVELHNFYFSELIQLNYITHTHTDVLHDSPFGAESA